MYQLLERYGDVAPDVVWHRLVQVLEAQPTVQPYAARGMVELLRRGSTHEVRVWEEQGVRRKGLCRAVSCQWQTGAGEIPLERVRH